MMILMHCMHKNNIPFTFSQSSHILVSELECCAIQLRSKQMLWIITLSWPLLKCQYVSLSWLINYYLTNSLWQCEHWSCMVPFRETIWSSTVTQTNWLSCPDPAHSLWEQYYKMNYTVTATTSLLHNHTRLNAGWKRVNWK